MTEESLTLGDIRPPASDNQITLGDINNGMSEDTLAHFGVKGMKWGIRHLVGADGHVTSTPGVPDHINREAHADAKRHAHLLHGSPSNGTTRYLYHQHAAKVNARARIDPQYKKAFLNHKTAEENKVLNRQIATALAVGTAFTLYHLNGNSVKINGPLLKGTSKAVVSGAKFVAKIGPTMMTNYKFNQITKNF